MRDIDALVEFDRRLVTRARRSIVTGSIPRDVVEELIDALIRSEERRQQSADEHRKERLDLEDMIVRLGGGTGKDRATPRYDREPPKVLRRGSWEDA